MTKPKTVRNTPADPTLPKVPVIIDGVTYFLVWDFNAIALAESLTRLNLLNALNFDGINASQLRAMFFAALQKHHSELTLDQAGALIRFSTMPKIIEALSEAYQDSNPEAEPENKSPNAETPQSLN